MSEQEELILEEKLTRGLAWSYEKMLCEKASRNEEVLISQGGTIRAVPAKEVLETYLREKTLD